MIPLKVLIIEDSESDAALVVRVLEKAGYDIFAHRVENDSDLNSALEEHNWDIIIADYQLPNFNAPSALAILQDSGIDIPFIVVSGAIGEETAVSLMKSGACDCVMKSSLSRLPPIVERELSESQLRRSRKNDLELLRLQSAALESAANSIVITDRDGMITWANPAFTTLTGYSLSEAIGKNPRELVKSGHHDQHFYKEMWEKILGGGVWQGEILNKRKDGSHYYEELTITPVFDINGDISQFVAIKQDITTRKEAEQLLVEKLQEKNRHAHELEIITSISSSMRKAETQIELENIFLQKLVSLMGARYATVAFLENSTLMFTQAIGSVRTWSKQLIKSNFGIFGDLIHSGKPVIIEHCNTSNELELPVWIDDFFPNIKSLIVFPLQSGANTIGTVFLGFAEANQFGPEQKNLIETVSEMAGNALKRMSSVEKLNAMVTRRERELENIYRVTSSASKTLDIEKALKNALGLTIQAIGANVGAVYLLDEISNKPELFVNEGSDPEQLIFFKNETIKQHLKRIVSQNKSIVLPNLTANKELAFIGFPMRSQDRVVGVLALIRKGEEEVILEEMTLLSFIADHLALIVENTMLYKKAEHTLIMEERSRLSRELHDSITQSLYSANLISAGAQKYAAQKKYTEVDSCLKQISHLSLQALREMRLLIYELRSPELAKSGLIGALQARLDSVERRLNIKGEIDGTNYSPLPQRIEENVYRIVIEGLNNSLKHAQASKVSITLINKEDILFLEIQDDGIGFESESALHAGGMGLISISERAKQLGGSFKVNSEPGHGARLEVQIPVLVKNR